MPVGRTRSLLRFLISSSIGACCALSLRAARRCAEGTGWFTTIVPGGSPNDHYEDDDRLPGTGLDRITSTASADAQLCPGFLGLWNDTEDWIVLCARRAQVQLKRSTWRQLRYVTPTRLGWIDPLPRGR